MRDYSYWYANRHTMQEMRRMGVLPGPTKLHTVPTLSNIHTHKVENMYQTIRADMIFKHNKFRLPEQRQIFTALEEPRITMGSNGDIVQLQVKMSGNKQRLLRLKYGSYVEVWNNDV